MIFHEVRDTQGKIVSSNLENCSFCKKFKNEESENTVIGDHRNVFRSFDNGSVRLISENNNELISSTRARERTACAFRELIPILSRLKENDDLRYSILSHNLTETHANLQGEIGTIIDDELLQGTTQLDLSLRNIKQVLLSLSYPFYKDLGAKRILFSIDFTEGFAEENLAMIDYNFFNVAIHHFMNNVVKYCKYNSSVSVNLLLNPLRLEFSMLSVHIDNMELDKIFNLNYSGKNVGNLAGSGIGMFMTKKALLLMNSDIKIIPGSENGLDNYTGLPYSNNVFIIYLNRI